MLWTVVSGGPPPGVTFNAATGAFGGTPLLSGPYPNNMTVIVSDGLGGTGGPTEISFPIAAAAAPQPYTLNISPTSFSGQVGVPFTGQLTASQ